MAAIRLLSLFSGIGGFELALRQLQIPFEVVNYCEIDPDISKCYSIIHNEPQEKNLEDIRRINISELPDFDIVTCGFPCQDISCMGTQKGIIKGETKSGLVYDALKIVENKKPLYAVFENVVSLTHSNNIKAYKDIINKLVSAGYIYYCGILDSQYFGIPQHRERLFIVCIRKDLRQGFNFPEGNKGAKSKLKDFVELELEHDQKDSDSYYLSSHEIRIFLEKRKKENYRYEFNIRNLNEVANTINTHTAKQAPNNTYIIDIFGVRGLTERECFKLQGINADYADMLKEKSIPKSKLYKMAGNAVSVNVAKEVFRNLLINKAEDRVLFIHIGSNQKNIIDKK